MESKRWSELTRSQQQGIIGFGIVQFLLLFATLWDLRRRPEDEIRGSKRLWALAAFVNWIGPLSYFLFGRRRP